MTSPILTSTTRALRIGFANVKCKHNRRAFSSTTKMSQEIKDMPQASYFPAIKTTMLPEGTFKDKVVLISGGGTGLGKGMAKKFSDLGAKVAIASRRLNVLEEAAKGNPIFCLNKRHTDPLSNKIAIVVPSKVQLDNSFTHILEIHDGWKKLKDEKKKERRARKKASG